MLCLSTSAHIQLPFVKIKDNNLSDLLCDVCDIQILPEFKVPQDESRHLTYNISGKTFARTGSGSEYILLEISQQKDRRAR